MTRSNTSLVAGFVIGLVYNPFRVALLDIVSPLGGGPLGMENSAIVVTLLPLVVIPGAAVGAGYVLGNRSPNGALGLPMVAFSVAVVLGLAAGIWVASVVFPDAATVPTNWRSVGFIAASFAPPTVHAGVAALAGVLVADRNR
ncbi:hypothetical protein [Halobacterium jilantaiense]|uniref:Uncharacterized protein n=1 Tax=Halobacterium jilantaiense TaxID=355548 RepID=A0A1I0MLN7_9EURY|nr:hypothetical protein [Halobacterium jilantaiense]SEV89072.1 hypothetical protein SAMN04487945_0165 [Halobacterium jilantaiense]